MALFPDKIDQNFSSKELISNSKEATQDKASLSNPENHDDEVPIDENFNGMRSEPKINLSTKEPLSAGRLNISNSSPGLKTYASLPDPFPFSLNSPRSKPSISNSSSTGHGTNNKVCITPLLPSPKKKSNIPFGPSHMGSQSHHPPTSDSQHAHFNAPVSNQPNKHLSFGPSTPISHISSQSASLQQQQQANSMLGRRKTTPMIQNSLLQKFKNSNSQASHESDQEIEQNSNLIKQYIKDLEENQINRGNYIPDSGSASPDDVDAINNHQIDDHKNTPSSNESSDNNNTVEKETSEKEKEKEKSDSNSKLVAEKTVVKLFNALSKPYYVINMKEDLLNELIKTIKKIMSISITDKIPHKYIYSDQVVNLRLTNWAEYQYVHKTLSLILHHGNRRIISEVFINQDFAHLLFEFYNSPESEERLVIDDIFHFLSDSFQTFNRFIYHECFTRILNHIQDDKDSFYCITPALSYLYNFFNSDSTILVMNHNSKLQTDSHYSIMKSDGIKKSSSSDMANFDDQPESVIPNQEANYIDIFQRYLLPLFSSNFLPAFYSQLSQICSQFYGFFDQEAPLLSIKYLLGHWPTTNSQKQTIFINHIGVILPFVSSDNIEKIALPIFNRFSLCLQCNNYKVTNSTLNLINNETFFSTFSSYPQIIIPVIVPQLLGLDDHWCSDLNGKHNIILQKLMALKPELYSETQSMYEGNKMNNENNSTKNEENINNWKLLIDTAHETYSEINADEYSKNLKLINST